MLLAPGVGGVRAASAAGIERENDYYIARFERSTLKQMQGEGSSDPEAAARFDMRNRSVIGLRRRQYDKRGLAALPARPRYPSAV